MKNLFLVFSILFFSNLLAQTDSLVIQDSISRIRIYTSTEKSLDLRLGYGKYDAHFIEIGIAKTTVTWGCMGNTGSSIYGSLEFIPSQWTHHEENIYAIKTGAEVNILFFSLGAEAKYQTDFHQNDFVLSPKVGIGFANRFMVYYAYQASLHNQPFDDALSPHQFQVVCNITLKKINK